MKKGEMAAHVARLCGDLGIAVVPHSSGGRADRRRRTIAIRPVRSARTYAVALHEIGHVVGPWQSRQRLYAEAGAWFWAREHALEWSEQVSKTCARCLQSYLDHARAKHARGVRNAPKIPEEGHPFWALLAGG